MNELTFERLADRLVSAQKREGLLNKEVAEIFDVPASYMSYMNRHPEKTPASFMVKIRAWDVSGKSLRGYTITEDTMSQQQIEEAAGFTMPAGDIKLTVTPVNDHGEPAPEKKRIAAKTRKVFEQQQKPETTEEVTRVETKDGKVDLSGVDFRTGVLAVLEIYEDGFVLRTKIPVKQ